MAANAKAKAPATATGAPKKTIVFERIFNAPAQDVWDLWTTKDGIESWWGPDGFDVTVQKIDLRPGGDLDYTMTATGSGQIQFMEANGRPLSSKHRATYVEVKPLRRLAYAHYNDFVPGLAPFDVAHVVELKETKAGIHLVLTVDAIPDPQFNRFMELGWNNELDNLAKLLEA